MTFLSPWMLAGAAAVGIPIALHFFYRARYKPLPWAPMKFLKEAIEQTSRRLRFQEWILLALRCLALLLLALAIARPAWNTASTAGRGEAVDAVLVFDTSFSMDARDGDKTRLERAKEAALAVLDALPANSSVQVLACSGDAAKSLGPVNRFNRDQAKQLVASIETTSLPGDLLPGITTALAAAETGTAPAKEVYVFTDMQKAGFEKQQPALKAKCEEVRKKANLVFVRCGNADRKPVNVAVVGVNLGGDIPHTKTRVPIEVVLTNTGTEPAKGVKVGVELDGKAVGGDEIQIDNLDPGQTYPVTLTATLERPGVNVIRVTARNDDLPGDNAFVRTLFVRDKVRVLLVDGAPNPDDPTAAGDHFVRTALNPDAAADYFIEPTSVPAAEAGRRDLADKDVVYLLNAPVRTTEPTVGMSADFLAALNQFVRDGGGLVVAGGDRVNPEAYTAALGSKGHGLLPFDLKGIRNTTETTPDRPAADGVDPLSFLAPFRKQPFADAFQRVALVRMLDVDESGPGGRVLAKTTDGRPYVAARTVGEGEVILVTGSLDEGWGNFSSDPGSFHIPFTVFTLTHLTGRKVAGGTLTAGERLPWVRPDPPDQAGYEVVRPSTGLLVTNVAPGGAADRGGVKADDRIVEAGGNPVRHAAGLAAAGRTAKPGTKVEVVVDRDRERATLNLDPAAVTELAGVVREDRPRTNAEPPKAAEGEPQPEDPMADTARAGLYVVVPTGKSDDPEPGTPVFSVNPDLRESANLAVAADAEIGDWLGYKPPIVQAGATAGADAARIRTRSEWTVWVLLALFAVLVAEAAWAWVCGRAW